MYKHVHISIINLSFLSVCVSLTIHPIIKMLSWVILMKVKDIFFHVRLTVCLSVWLFVCLLLVENVTFVTFPTAGDRKTDKNYQTDKRTRKKISLISISMTHDNILMIQRIVSETQADRQLKFIMDIDIYIYIYIL